jgi:hypothetical protein
MRIHPLKCGDHSEFLSLAVTCMGTAILRDNEMMTGTNVPDHQCLRPKCPLITAWSASIGWVPVASIDASQLASVDDSPASPSLATRAKFGAQR